MPTLDQILCAAGANRVADVMGAAGANPDEIIWHQYYRMQAKDGRAWTAQTYPLYSGP